MGPRDAPLSAITLSLHQGHAAAAVVTLILQDGLMQGPNEPLYQSDVVSTTL